jgi:hypothetical protein
MNLHSNSYPAIRRAIIGGALMLVSALMLPVPVSVAAEPGLAPGAFETIVVPSPFDDRRTGEPSIAVNPTDPNNIVIGFLASTETDRNPERTVPQYTSVPYNLLCGVATSFDRGRTWKAQELRIPVGAIPTTKTPMPKGAVCFDPMVSVAADGTFYISGVVSSPYDYGKSAGHGKDVEMMGLFRSTDKGRTWTLYEVQGGGAGIPFHVTDQTTGIVYAVNKLSDLSISRDRGETFELISGSSGFRVTPQGLAGKTPWRDESVMPGAFYSTYISAGNGQLAVAHVDDRVGGETAGCPCVELSVSTDAGKSFASHAAPMDIPLGKTPYARNVPDVMVAVDPSRKGRMAVAYVEPTHTQLIVLVTDDAGKTWSKPIRLGHDDGFVNRMSIAYGPAGVLAAMWRSEYDKEVPFKPSVMKPARVWNDAVPGPQDIFVAVAPKGDVDFAVPVKVNAVRSPPSPRAEDGQDDYSGLAVDKEAVHVAWGDRRERDLSLWYGQVPLKAFKGKAPVLAAPPAPTPDAKSKTPSTFEE